MTRINYAQIVGGWLTDLANLCAGGTPISDAKAKIAAMTAVISEDFPPEAFNRQSLVAVSKRCKFFPSYAELNEALTEWWRENRPALKALTGPNTAHLNDDEQYWIRSWQRHRAGDWGKAKDGTPCSGSPRHLRFELELMKKSYPEAFKWLVLYDQEAGRIAALAGWSDSSTEISPTDEEREAVRHSVKKATQAIQRAKIPVTTDPEAQLKALAAASAEKFHKQHGRYPGQLSQEQLERLREQNPALKAARKAA